MSDAEAVELQAALDDLVVSDGSAYARLLGTGPDLLGLLQRLGTGDVAGLAEGRGRATVLTTNKGRIVQRLFACHLGEHGVLLLGGAGGAPVVLDHLKRYTFAEDTGLTDVTGTTALWVVTGPRAAEAVEELGLPAPAPLASRPVRVAGFDAHVVGTDGCAASGYALLAPAAGKAAVGAAIADAVVARGGRRASPDTLESARVLRGLGAHGHEWTERYNPLEAGLRDAVSFTKGCYVGQEVVARLENYDKVSRRLMGIEFPANATPPPPDTPLHRDGREVGRVTSALVVPGRDHGVGIASVKHREAAVGDTAATSETNLEVRLVALPFSTPDGVAP